MRAALTVRFLTADCADKRDGPFFHEPVRQGEEESEKEDEDELPASLQAFHCKAPNRPATRSFVRRIPSLSLIRVIGVIRGKKV